MRQLGRYVKAESCTYTSLTGHIQTYSISSPPWNDFLSTKLYYLDNSGERGRKVRTETGQLLHPDFAMSVDPPAYIVSLQNNIRARPISWEGAVRAKTITDDDLKKIKAIDKVRKEQRKSTIESDVQTYTTLLLGNGQTKSIFENTAKRTDILQYMLVLTGDLVDGVFTLAHPPLSLAAPLKHVYSD